MGMDIVEFFMAIENEFQIVIPNDVATKLCLLGELHAFVVASLNERADSVDPEKVWSQIKRVAVEHCPVQESEVVPNAHLIHDFGMG